MSATLPLACTSAAFLLMSASTGAQRNDAPLNNGAEVYYTYSDPSAGAPTGSNPPDPTSDLFWRAHPGDGFTNDVDPALGSAMEVDGYWETLLDEDWSTSASFLDRTHGPAVATPTGLQPAFFSLGLTTEVLVSLGPSGFKSPCTLYPSLCSPSGSTCAPAGTALGWVVDVAFATTPGTGVVLPADGTPASDMATTYFFQGGWSTTGGLCGGGTYETSDLHSVDETQADVTGLGTNPSGGFQILGGGPVNEGLVSMAASNETFRGNVLNMVADRSGLGAVIGPNGGGGTSGRNLSVGAGTATLAVELRDESAVGTPNLAIAGASTAPIANPGIPLLGGWLGVTPNGVFTATSAAWQGTATPPGVPLGVPIFVPASAAGVKLFTQGAVFSLVTFTADTTNVVRTNLLP